MKRATWNPATAMVLAGFGACALVGWLAGTGAPAQEALPIQGRVAGPPSRPAASGPAGSQPASGPAATEKGPWADVELGMTVKFTLAGNVTQTREIIKADANTVTIRSIITVPGTKPVESEVPRLYTPEQVQQIMEGYGKRKGEETLQVSGREYPCEIYERPMEVARRRTVTRTWLCKQVPGWSVRVDSDAGGQMKTILQLVEYKTQ